VTVSLRCPPVSFCSVLYVDNLIVLLYFIAYIVIFAIILHTRVILFPCAVGTFNKRLLTYLLV